MIRTLAKLALNYRGLRRQYARELLFRQAHRFTPTLQTSYCGADFLVFTRDRVVSRNVYVWGAFEDYWQLKTVRAALPTVTGVFVDIGANIGTASVAAVREFGFAEAVAFEPEPKNFRLMTASLALNSAPVTAVNAALGERCGAVTMTRDRVNFGNHRVAAGDQTVLSTFDTHVLAGVIPLERVGLVWMDVQGYEGHVMRGADLLKGIPLVTEIEPSSLRANGTLESFSGALETRFERFTDLRSTEVAWRPMDRLAELVASCEGSAATILLR